MKARTICGLALIVALPLLLASCVVHVHERPGPGVATGYDATVYGYYYYPSSYVYYDPVDRIYFYIGSSGTWLHGSVLPRTIVINQRERVTVKLAGKKPYHYWHKHYKKHPPKKRKIAPGQLKRKDTERARKAVLGPKIKTGLKDEFRGAKPGEEKRKGGLKRGLRKTGKGRGKKEEVKDTDEDEGEVEKGRGRGKKGAVKDSDEDEEEVEKEEGKGKKEKEDKKDKKEKKPRK